ncbi:MAG: carboxypeptidase regulatory-like domain-containing protein [Acidobacteria bacterium]|nr:carboxypeptidase regulatory-like domain-containing protein [Acidobacteriota bacterium]
MFTVALFHGPVLVGAHEQIDSGAGAYSDRHRVIAVSMPAVPGQRIPGRRAETKAAIQGQVRDASGRPIPGASVRLIYAQTPRTLELTADGDGVFRARGLEPGECQVVIEMAGYEPKHRTGLVLNAGQTVSLEIEMLSTTGGNPAEPSGREGERLITRNRLGDLGDHAESSTARSMEGMHPALRPRPEEVAEAPIRSIDGIDLNRVDPPLGYSGPLRPPPPAPTHGRFEVYEDRWRIGFPDWNRGGPGEAPYVRGRWYDPFHQNMLKGDYPVIGQHIFLSLTAASDTLAEPRRLYVPSGASAFQPGRTPFFGRGEQFLLTQNFLVSVDLFRGDAGFRPRDWSIRITPVFNINFLQTRENGLVNIDVRKGTLRTDGQVALQELFGEVKLFDVGSHFDFVSVRAGIQPFVSDFRGFIFVDEQPGIRFFGNFGSNRNQWNAAIFTLLEKDTNSVLNTLFEPRHQYVAVANFSRQDFLAKGYTIQASLHYSDDHAGRSDEEGGLHFDTNGFLVRPAAAGAFTPHNIKVGYLGIAGEGHIGRLNVSHAFYQALGRDDLNPIAGRGVHINAQMAAAEFSYERDWLSFKGSFFFSSGDSDPTDGTARGFDAILDNPNFAGGSGFSFSNRPLTRDNLFQPNIPGGGFGFWNRQGIALAGTSVGLVHRQSLLPSLRSNKDEGQASFVNPGLFLYNLGVDAAITPKMKGSFNINYLQFHRTEPLELLLFQPGLRRSIGLDYSLGFQYRPFLNDQCIITAGAAGLTPGDGLKRIYTSKTLYSTFVGVRLMF